MHAKRAQQSMMGNKVYLSMHPRNFCSDNRPPMRPRLHVSGNQIPHLRAWSPRHCVADQCQKALSRAL